MARHQNERLPLVLYADIPRVAMQVSQGVVVASIQVDLDEDVLARFREDLLDRVHETGSEAVILDVSGLETLDSVEFATLRQLIATTGILGADSVLVGLRPGVVSALIESNVDVDGLRTAVDLDAAFELLRPASEDETASERDQGEESEAQDAIASELESELAQVDEG